MIHSLKLYEGKKRNYTKAKPFDIKFYTFPITTHQKEFRKYCVCMYMCMYICMCVHACVRKGHARA